MKASFARRAVWGSLRRFQKTIGGCNRPQQQRFSFFQNQQLQRLSEWKPNPNSNSTPTPHVRKIPSKPQQRLTTTTTTTTATTTTEAAKQQKPSKKPPSSFSKQWNSPSSVGRDDASLARYPDWQTAGGLLRGADYAGTITFALTGTITAAQSGLDVFGSAMVGVITSVGGGTIRDAIFLGRKPFWTEETEYIWMGLVTGAVAFFVWPKTVLEWKQTKQKEIEEERKNTFARVGNNDDESATEYYDTIDAVLDTLDAVGLSAFAIIGAQNGIRAGMPMLVSAICGMVTATFGGVVRDVLCGRPVRIVHSTAELYASTALAGATVYLVSKRVGGSPAMRIPAAIATCMGIRYCAVQNDLKLHTWDTVHDNLGVTVRKHPTKNLNYRNE